MAIDTGFEAERVYQALRDLQSAYEELCNALGNYVQRQFIDFMSENWACTEAQEFFEQLINILIDERKDIDRIFQSVNDAMNGGGATWAAKTGNSGVFTKIGFVVSGQKADASSIKENIAGVRGINVGCEGEAASRLSAVTQRADNALDKAVKAVASAGFIGAGQQAALTASLTKIKGNINNANTELANSLKKGVAATVEKYKSTATTITDAFTG